MSNIREDRTDLDLLYACLLDQGLGIHLPHTSRVVGGCTVHRVDGGVLAACFDAGVPDTVIRDIAASRPQWAVFRDSAFASDAAKINVTEIFKSLSPAPASRYSECRPSAWFHSAETFPVLPGCVPSAPDIRR